MDPRLLRYYERELKHVREMGGEFAREFPKIAGRLGLDAFECADPYVERLIEAFAFLTARIQLKLDAEFPSFTQHMLELLYPGYLAPTPSMAMVQLRPNLREGALVEGYRVPRGTALRSRLGRQEQTSCEYRTAHDVTLWPLEIVAAEYTTMVRELVHLDRVPAPRARAAVRLTLRTAGEMTFEQLALDRLPLFLRGADETAMRLYEQLLSATVGMVVRPAGDRGRPEVIAETCVAPLGFEDGQALLPCGPRSLHGHRLLHEYFAFPARYMFVELRHLAGAVRRCPSRTLEVILLLDRAEPRLEGVVTEQSFSLFCTPAINLFPRAADRIHLGNRDHEYHVVPDRTRPLDLEVYGVTRAVGYGARSDAVEFLPMYAPDARTAAGETAAWYTLRRQARLLSARERAHGSRSRYVGSEVFISLVDGEHGPFRRDLRQLAISTLCTNRDLPLHMSLGSGNTDFTLESGAPVDSIRCMAGPTPPRPSHAHGPTAWRLLSHLSLDYLSLLGRDAEQCAAALRELLSLYGELSDLATLKQIRGLQGIEARGVVRPLPMAGPISFGRGMEVSLHCDELAFDGSGPFLLGAVLERFFARYASINAFTETVLHTTQRGEIMRWPATVGRRQVL